MSDLGSIIATLAISTVVGFVIGAAAGHVFLSWDRYMHRAEVRRRESK